MAPAALDALLQQYRTGLERVVAVPLQGRYSVRHGAIIAGRQSGINPPNRSGEFSVARVR
jgi:hypothetical protein